jgi:hypothetical protein
MQPYDTHLPCFVEFLAYCVVIQTSPPNTVWKTAYHMDIFVPIIRSRPAAGVVVSSPEILISHGLYVGGTAFR